MNDDICSRFERMQTRLNSLPDTPTQPTSTLDIIRHGHEEKFWNRLLAYFLTPTESHQLGTAVLEAFLSSVEDRHSEFTYSRLGYEDIEIRDEVATGHGVADLIIHVEGEWFLWIEMKVRSSEHSGQTRGYVDESSLGENIQKSDFPESGHHYVFLADESKSADTARFETVGWQSVVHSFEDVLQEYGQFPLQSLAQLNDFCETIRNEIGMSKKKQNRNELAGLAIEYADEMRQVDEALESYTKELQESWAEQLQEHPPDGWGPNWTTQTNGQWADFYRPEWFIRSTDDPTAVGNTARFHLRIQHEIEPKKLKRGFVETRFQVTGRDNSLVDEFYKQLYSPETEERLETIVEDIHKQPGTTATLHNRPELVYKKIIHVNCDFEFNNGDGYVLALRSALEKLSPVAEIVDDIYEKEVATRI